MDKAGGNQKREKPIARESGRFVVARQAVRSDRVTTARIRAAVRKVKEERDSRKP
jgi:hypothetical protein